MPDLNPADLRPDWRPILDYLAAARSVVITSHVNPDGDAIGSEVALAAWLAESGKRTRIVNADPIPDRYRFLADPGGHEPADPADHARVAAEADLVVVLDVSRWDRLGAAGEVLARSAAPRLCIDHHPGGADFPVAAAVIDPSRAATGELLFEMMEAAGRPPDAPAARALYVAIMTDTGSFRYSNTAPRTHRIAARLMESGLDPADLYDRAYGQSSVARLRLFGEALTRMVRSDDGAVVTTAIDRETLARLGASPAESEGLAEMLRGADGCRVAAVFTEGEPGRVKVSLRSRGNVDVNEVARALGGGGHARAAGIPAEGTLPDVSARITAALLEACRRTPET